MPTQTYTFPGRNGNLSHCTITSAIFHGDTLNTTNTH